MIAVVIYMECPDLLDEMAALGHRPAVPEYVLKHELTKDATRAGVNALVSGKKLTVLGTVGIDQVENFMEDYSKVHTGECHVLLDCQNRMDAPGGAYCIIDDMEARKAADLGIPHTGTVGIIQYLWSMGVTAQETALGRLDRLEKSGFYGTSELFEDARRSISGPNPGD